MILKEMATKARAAALSLNGANIELINDALGLMA